ncbi:MAG: hypothetical protein K6T75_09605 [Acetobacteraceae bacterium]|nr:hypothetical protein [Acetobacteraceae bacterium]
MCVNKFVGSIPSGSFLGVFRAGQEGALGRPEARQKPLECRGLGLQLPVKAGRGIVQGAVEPPVKQGRLSSNACPIAEGVSLPPAEFL